MSAVEGGLVAAVVLLALLVALLLRAHAATARRLAVLERRALRTARHEPTSMPTPKTTPTTASSTTGPPLEDDDSAVDLRGTAPDGTATTYPLEHLAERTVVAFLSTTCGTCLELWRHLRDEGLDGATAVVVTKDAAAEQLEVARGMTESGDLVVVMSSEAWEEYEVPGSPYVLVLDGDPGAVVAEGATDTWVSLQRLAASSAG